MVQWLRLCTSTAGVTGSIAGQGTKILNATQPKKIKKKKKKRLSQFKGRAVCPMISVLVLIRGEERLS